MATFFALAVGLLIATYIIHTHQFKYKYKQLHVGMTVDKAEAVLGTSQELGKWYVPRTSKGPVIKGERFFIWEDKATASVIWIGTSDGKISDSWYWEPSL